MIKTDQQRMAYNARKRNVATYKMRITAVSCIGHSYSF